MKRTMLKRYHSLKAKKAINKQGKNGKSKANEVLWQRIKFARAKFLYGKYGVIICEYCGHAPWGNELGQIDGHHIDGNHKHSTEENCYLAHRICHDKITRERIKVKQLDFQGVKNGGNDEQ